MPNPPRPLYDAMISSVERTFVNCNDAPTDGRGNIRGGPDLVSDRIVNYFTIRYPIR